VLFSPLYWLGKTGPGRSVACRSILLGAKIAQNYTVPQCIFTQTFFNWCSVRCVLLWKVNNCYVYKLTRTNFCSDEKWIRIKSLATVLARFMDKKKQTEQCIKFEFNANTYSSTDACCTIENMKQALSYNKCTVKSGRTTP
jgi:hypothetical protein